MKKIVSLFVLACILVSSLPTAGTHAAAPCASYSGSNTGSQDYTRAASTAKSYLTVCGDGSLLKFQYIGSEKSYVAEYYDASYNLLHTETIDAELPIFGAFYAYGDHYFILTGQENPEESNDVEVFRITKFDKNWERVASTGLYGANTTMPFRSGSARIDGYGNYLFIRTSHTMYASSDGINHQANVTIQLDTDTMQVTDSFTGIMNISYGYVSHSFNQFIKIDNGSVVAVDHGDAYPRSIVLVKYNTDVLSGRFRSTSCKATNILEIPGSVGNNYTGVSVGGFEISSTDYLVAGNMADLGHFEATGYDSTRNIFVASVSKSTNAVTLNQITDYQEGKASTPHLVRLGDDDYILLWGRDDQVYYTKIDGSGKQTGSIYNFTGSLSDCSPIIFNGKLVWYVWKDGTTAFYEIDGSKISSSHSVAVDNGHNFEPSSIKKNVATLKCTKCGEKRSVDTPVSFTVWWKQDNADMYFYSRYSNPFEVGDSIEYWVSYEMANTLKTGQANTKFILEFSDSTAAEIIPVDDTWLEGMGTIKMLKPGKYTLSIRHIYDDSLSQEFTFTVNAKEPDKVSLNKKSLELEVGGKYKLKPSIPADTETTFTWTSSDKKVATVAKNGWVKAIGTGTAKITVKTANGKKATCKVTVK